MTAIQFFNIYQRDGRALLRGNADRFFIQQLERLGRPSTSFRPDMWLIRHNGILLLCVDAVHPVSSAIADNQQINEASHDEWTTGPIETTPHLTLN